MGRAPQPPQALYGTLAVKLRSRIEFAERILGLSAHPAQIVETVCLQGRKAIETIAYMMLAATELGFGRANMPRDTKTQWNAETIFYRLKKKGLKIMPSPQRIGRSTRSGVQVEITGVAEHRLNYDELAEIYRTFHRGLHEPNPYVQGDDDTFYTKLIPELRGCVQQIRNLTWTHMVFIRGQAFLCMLSTDQDKVAVWPLEKVAELPPDP